MAAADVTSSRRRHYGRRWSTRRPPRPARPPPRLSWSVRRSVRPRCSRPRRPRPKVSTRSGRPQPSPASHGEGSLSRRLPLSLLSSLSRPPGLPARPPRGTAVPTTSAFVPLPLGVPVPEPSFATRAARLNPECPRLLSRLVSRTRPLALSCLWPLCPFPLTPPPPPQPPLPRNRPTSASRPRPRPAPCARRWARISG